MALGLTYNHIFASEDISFSSYYNSYKPLKNVPSTYSGTDYSLKGFTIGYDSKYYFQDFDEDGANGFYIGFNYQLSNITENATMKYDYNSMETKLQPSTYNINRLGVKVGFTTSDVITQQFGIGMFYNMPSSNQNSTWISPIEVNSLSFNISWVLGIPF